MSVENNPYKDLTGFMISLNPPGAEGEEYSNLVTGAGGTPLGQGGNVIAKILGYSSTDELSSAETLQEVQQLLSKLNISSQFFGLNQTSENLIKLQLDTLDPSNPFIPIILKFVKIADDSLKNGDIEGNKGGNVKGSQEIDNNEGSNVAGVDDHGGQVAGLVNSGGEEVAEILGDAKVTVETNVITKSKGNPWLAGNAYTAFVMCYFDLILELKRMKEVDGQIEVKGMNQMYELAKESADTIVKAAKERAMMHIMQAVVAGISAAVTVAATAISCVKTSKMVAEDGSAVDPKTGGKMSPEQAKLFNAKLTSGWLGTQTLQHGWLPASQSATKMIDDIIQAVYEVKAAVYDALKELIQAYRQIAQHQMEKATEGFKSESEMISQLIQQLDQIRQKLHDAIAASMRK